MIDAFVEKLSRDISEETNKKIKQICAEKPEIIQNHERVVICKQDEFFERQTIKNTGLRLTEKKLPDFASDWTIEQMGVYK